MREDIFYCNHCEKWSLLFKTYDLISNEQDDPDNLHYVWIYVCQSCEHEEILENPL